MHASDEGVMEQLRGISGTDFQSRHRIGRMKDMPGDYSSEKW